MSGEDNCLVDLNVEGTRYRFNIGVISVSWQRATKDWNFVERSISLFNAQTIERGLFTERRHVEINETIIRKPSRSSRYRRQSTDSIARNRAVFRSVKHAADVYRFPGAGHLLQDTSNFANNLPGERYNLRTN